MENEIINKMKTVRIGITLSLLTLLFAFFLGGLFGAVEGKIKGHLKSEAQTVYQTVYKSDSVKMEKITTKSWVYLKRSHMHAAGLGTTSLSIILLLMFLPTTLMLKKVISTFLGLGAFGYPIFWLLAGLKAPKLGSTGAAKEALSFLAIPSAGFIIISILSVLLIVIKTMYFTQDNSNQN